MVAMLTLGQSASQFYLLLCEIFVTHLILVQIYLCDTHFSPTKCDKWYVNISWVFIMKYLRIQMILVEIDIMWYGLIVCKWIADERLF